MTDVTSAIGTIIIGGRYSLLNTLMRASGIEILYRVFPQHPSQMIFAQNQDMVSTFGANASQKSFNNCVAVWRLAGSLYDSDAGASATAANWAPNLLSPSRIRHFGPSPKGVTSSHRALTTIGFCWLGMSLGSSTGRICHSPHSNIAICGLGHQATVERNPWYSLLDVESSQ